ncbi:GntR family transcriptional regulator [Leifsonia kafniensis]|uniref:GntR family transcriptional regulator n=1 Tax=Leifsonia kafniensis TaxID=475957 RepID=A0ABP7KUJ8_9MICO
MRASDIAYERLRDDIIHWRLEPGAPLAEIEVSARIGVSRTPVREALSRLINEGLVSNNSGRTAVVTPVSRAHIEQLFELREALETQAARLAARRRDSSSFESLKEAFLATTDAAAATNNVGTAAESGDSSDASYLLADRLDAAIDEAMDNSYLRSALKDIRGHLARARRHAHANPIRLEQARTEHLLIIDAILRRDEMLAGQATAVHLRNSLDNILATIPPLPGGSAPTTSTTSTASTTNTETNTGTTPETNAAASASPRKDIP